MARKTTSNGGLFGEEELSSLSLFTDTKDVSRKAQEVQLFNEFINAKHTFPQVLTDEQRERNLKVAQMKAKIAAYRIASEMGEVREELLRKAKEEK